MINTQKTRYLTVFSSVGMPIIHASQVHMKNPCASQQHVLGQGGLGVVYAGTYQGQPVAIKTLHRADPEMVDALKKEAMVMQRVSSPHTVSLLGMMEDGGAVSLVMERLGISLYQRIHQKGPFPWPQRYRLAHEIAKGLGAMHQHGLVHGKITSHQVLLDASGHAKIINFSQVLEQDSENKPTTRPDIHAFGMILWALAARAVPSDGNNTIPEGCPQALAQLIKACWSGQLDASELIARIQALSAVNEPRVSVSWHVDAQILQHVDQHKDHQLIPALPGSSDFQKVINSYQMSPVLGYDIARVEVLYNPNLDRAFAIHLDRLERRHGQWPQKSHTVWGQQVLQRFKDWARQHKDPIAPHVDILPLWYGTHPDAVSDLCKTGYGNRLHFGVEARHAYQVHGQGALIMNWVAMGSVHPVMHKDLGNPDAQADAYITSVPPYHEVLVVHAAQCLPRYWVTLQPVLPQVIAVEPAYGVVNTISLFAAIGRNDLSWVLQCIHAGLDGEGLIYRGDHALTAALRCPTPEIFDGLCHRIAVPEKVQKDGEAHHVLHVLWTESAWPVDEKKHRIEKLMGHGFCFTHALCFGDADAMVTDGHQEKMDALGYRPVHYLVMGGDLARIQSWCTLMPEARHQVTEQGATLLLVAAEKGHGPVVQWLLNTGMAKADESNHYGETALLLAAKNGHLSLVQWLLHEGGSRLGEENHDGLTALLLAACTGQGSVVQWLCREGGAQINEDNGHGDTALLGAAYYGHLPVVQWLLEEGGAKVDELNVYGASAVMLAAYRGHLPVVQWLVTQAGATVHGRNTFGDTALMGAAKNGHLPVVQWLLDEGGACVDAYNNRGDTAVLLAASYGHLSLLQWLVNRSVLHVQKSNGDTPLLLAAKHGHLPVIQWLLHSGFAQINEKNYNQCTALIWAARKGHLPVIQWLLKQDASIFAEKDHNGFSMFLSAAYHGHLPVVQWLLHEGLASLDEKNNNGDNALILAIRSGNLALVQWLFQEGGSSLYQRNGCGDTLLLNAARTGDLPIVQWLLQEGLSRVDEKDKNGNTALLNAARTGHLPIVQWLLQEGGSRVDEKDNDGNTALLNAARTRHLPIVQWLLQEGGATLKEHNNAGETVLHTAAIHGFDLMLLWLMYQCGALMLDQKDPVWVNAALRLSAEKGLIATVENLVDACGAVVDEQDKLGYTALMWAAKKGHLPVVRWLHKACGASLYEQDQFGHTALLLAVKNGYLPVIQWLLKADGAMVGEKNHYGRTALLLAAKNSDLLLVQYLLEEGGASVYERDKWENTALLLAAKNGCLPVIQWLLASGGSMIDERDQHGHTALLLAAQNNHLSVVQWLLRAGGAMVNEKNNYGNTALLLAALKGHLPMVRWLLDEGKADACQKNKYGQDLQFFMKQEVHFFNSLHGLFSKKASRKQDRHGQWRTQGLNRP